jgi:hypothetical protein
VSILRYSRLLCASPFGFLPSFSLFFLCSKSAVYNLFREQGTEHDLALAGYTSTRYLSLGLTATKRFLIHLSVFLSHAVPFFLYLHGLHVFCIFVGMNGVKKKKKTQIHRPSDEFYALFYLGLYCEAHGENTKASLYMRQAVHTEYANSSTDRSGDYMTAVARVRERRELYSSCFVLLSEVMHEWPFFLTKYRTVRLFLSLCLQVHCMKRGWT